MRENCLAHCRIWHARQHCHLHYGHHLARLWTDHGEAKDAVVAADEKFEEALLLADRLCPEHGACRNLRYADRHAFALRLTFAQSDMRKRRVSKHAIGDKPVAGAAFTPGNIVFDDPDSVLRDMRKLRTSCTLS